MWLTLISTLATIISIICSIISIINAKKAKEYKEQVVNMKNAIKINEILEKYKQTRLQFFKETRSSDWYRGKDINLIISPMENILAETNSVLPMMKKTEDLKGKIILVTSEIRQFDKCVRKKKKEICDTLIEIEQILQSEQYNQTLKSISITKDS